MKEPRISEVHPADAEFSVAVTWRDGSKSIIGLSDPINRLKVFRPLRESGLFGQVQVADHGRRRFGSQPGASSPKVKRPRPSGSSANYRTPMTLIDVPSLIAS